MLNYGHTFGHALESLSGYGTFLHGGIPGLIDMVYRRNDATLVICDNSTTAMTGQQKNPASGHTSSGESAPEVDLVKLVESLGVELTEYR